MRLKITNKGIEVHTPYNKDFVTAIKMLPTPERRWQPNNRCWLVSSGQLDHIEKLCEQFFGLSPSIEGQPQVGPITETFRIEYIGSPKDRGQNELSSMGAIGEDRLEWSILFPESVLRRFFEDNPGEPSLNTSTFYSTLAIKRTAADTDIKKAYRQMAKRYHPDINKDDDANEMMEAINRAYDILKDPITRRKYDAGLFLQAQSGITVYKPNSRYYRPPLRCGLVTCTGTYDAGLFVVEAINDWRDITYMGMTLVTSWDVIGQSIVRNWI